MAAALAVMVTGCGRLGFAPGAPAADAASEGCALAEFLRPPASALVDDFGTRVLADQWDVSGACASAAMRTLVTTLAGGDATCAATTRPRLHLTCDHVAFKLEEPAAAKAGVVTLVSVGSAAGPLEVRLENARLRLGVPGAYADLGASEPMTDRWWRLSEREGKVTLETSGDGAAWRRRGAIPTPFPLDDVQVTLGARNEVGDATPGRARFRCFNLPPPCK